MKLNMQYVLLFCTEFKIASTLISKAEPQYLFLHLQSPSDNNYHESKVLGIHESKS